MKHPRFLTLVSLIVAATLLLAACQTATPPPATVAPDSQSEASVEEQNMAVVRRFYEEFSAGNADVILEVHPATVTMHFGGEAEEVEAQVLRDDLAALKQANPDLRAEIHSLFAQGDIVVTELTWTTTHTGDYFGIPATGATTTHNGIVVRRLQDGKIVESWEIWDDLVFLQSIGYLPSWDEIIAQHAEQAAATPEPLALPTLRANQTVATKIEDIVGIWRGAPGDPSDPPQVFWWFQPDGTYRAAFTVEQFKEGYAVDVGTFSFDGSVLTLTPTAKGCADLGPARYEARFTSVNTPQLKLVLIEEPCVSRRKSLTPSMPFVQSEP